MPPDYGYDNVYYYYPNNVTTNGAFQAYSVPITGTTGAIYDTGHIYTEPIYQNDTITTNTYRYEAADEDEFLQYIDSLVNHFNENAVEIQYCSDRQDVESDDEIDGSVLDEFLDGWRKDE